MANWARLSLLMSSSVLPENMEPQITSMQPDFFSFSKNISLTLLGEVQVILYCKDTNIMEKNERDFLQEAQKEIASLKERIASLEERLATFEAHVGEPEEASEVDFSDVELGVTDALPKPVPQPVEEPVNLPEPELIPEPAPEPEPEPILEPEPTPAPEPEPELKPAPASAPVPAGIGNYAWSKDKPGILVKNIRSGISLLDRALFIGTLFKEDFNLYDNTIAELNNLQSLDEAVAYIQEHFPEWEMGTDVVYRFMMAVRKKLG